jgi:DNA mismatch endonuclease Vsr
MRAIKGKNTKPELVVRRLLHAMGYRYRLHRRDLPGTPDIVFPTRRKAIQVHGCFWHQHKGCRHATVPTTRPNYWAPKLAMNVRRDRQTAAKMRALGWSLAVVWECRVKADPAGVARRLQAFLGPVRAGRQQMQAMPASHRPGTSR